MIGIFLFGLGIFLAFKPNEAAQSLPVVQVPQTLQPTPQSSINKEIKVFAASQITDTGIEVIKGQTINFSATGQVNAATAQNDGSFRWVNSDGWDSEPQFNTGRKGLLPSGQPFMALAARISKNKPVLDDEGWTFIGSNGRITATENGTLYLSVNEKVRDEKGVYHSNWFADNQGNFTVNIK